MSDYGLWPTRSPDFLALRFDCQDRFYCMDRVSITKDIAFYEATDAIDYYRMGNADASLCYIDEGISTYKFSMYLRKGSYLVKHVDAAMLRILEAGLYQKLESDFYGKMQNEHFEHKSFKRWANLSVNPPDDEDQGGDFVVLGNRHLSVSFYMLMIGYGLGCISFLAELLRYRIGDFMSPYGTQVRFRGHAVKFVAVKGEWRKLHSTELYALYSSPDIIRNIKSRRLRWAGHVARMGEYRSAYGVLVGRPEGKRPLGRPRRRWEDNVKMDLREVGYDDRDWINLAQDRDRWRAYVREAMNLRVPQKPFPDYIITEYFRRNVINLVDKVRATECTERKKSVRRPTKVTEDAVEDARERMQRGRN
ncbi:hypothetical protein ANN_05014 [Periplaneta americana]|uniref:Uncharacterized protein n=1 Tax=Periplaneta americana TaxID=6978 RepID=A0ABQ8TB71_PERAM|nr:hypothetical protein ANN_05014 [Periplaneta americana]